VKKLRANFLYALVDGAYMSPFRTPSALHGMLVRAADSSGPRGRSTQWTIRRMRAVSQSAGSYTDEPTWALYTLFKATRHEQRELPWTPGRIESSLHGKSLCWSLPGAPSFL